MNAKLSTNPHRDAVKADDDDDFENFESVNNDLCAPKSFGGKASVLQTVKLARARFCLFNIQSGSRRPFSGHRRPIALKQFMLLFA
ncbi:hypothetical protein LSTR_LSTR011019 [Laodelphax striatellus]|uniref:Uncharacterized protein n=1 Tax=Laodelphax striatellus TaxID=195883 RepID=A0A482XHJ0_LAOST|nr:hypothetical protein LSTR_LSTR011019 [Laodelphax striatellus]